MRKAGLTPRDITEAELDAKEFKANTVTATGAAINSFKSLTGKQLPCSPEDLRDYLLAAVNVGHALATITTRMGLLTTWHDDYLHEHGLTNQANPARHPSVVKRLKAIRRSIGDRQQQAEPLLYEHLMSCVLALEAKYNEAVNIPDRRESMKAQLTAVRDKAMFLIGFWFGLRSESLVSLKRRDVELKVGKHGKQLVLSLPETKTTDGSFERTLDELNCLCPIPALDDWIRLSNPEMDDPLFVSVSRWGGLSNTKIHVDSIIPMMRKVLDLANIDSRPFTTHSLRRGASIWADQRGASTKDRMEWFGWKDPTSALKYVDAEKSLPTVLQDNKEPVQRALAVLRAHVSERMSVGIIARDDSKAALELLAQIEVDL